MCYGADESVFFLLHLSFVAEGLKSCGWSTRWYTIILIIFINEYLKIIMMCWITEEGAINGGALDFYDLRVIDDEAIVVLEKMSWIFQCKWIAFDGETESYCKKLHYKLFMWCGMLECFFL